MKKLELFPLLTEAGKFTIKNFLPIFLAVILWLVTIWIPYLNVGTTIAILSLPIEISKGKMVNPLFIFDAKYRQFMGEFFTLKGLMALTLTPAYIFGVIPGIVISLGWSLATYILLDKGVAPGEAMVRSNKATYGYKWLIFGLKLIIVFAWILLYTLFAFILDAVPVLFCIVVLLLITLAVVYRTSCDAIIYRELASDVE